MSERTFMNSIWTSLTILFPFLLLLIFITYFLNLFSIGHLQLENTYLFPWGIEMGSMGVYMWSNNIVSYPSFLPLYSMFLRVKTTLVISFSPKMQDSAIYVVNILYLFWVMCKWINKCMSKNPLNIKTVKQETLWWRRQMEMRLFVVDKSLFSSVQLFSQV